MQTTSLVRTLPTCFFYRLVLPSFSLCATLFLASCGDAELEEQAKRNEAEKNATALRIAAKEAEEAEKAVQYARYAPEGQRGISPYWAMLAGLDFNDVVRSANEETVLVLQIESKEAYENIDEIAKVKGIDVLFVGPTDLSATLGVITETNSPEVQSVMRDVPKHLEGTGIMAGTKLNDVQEIQEKIE